MKTNTNNQKQVDAVLNSLDFTKEVKAPPYFKDQTLERLFSENTVKSSSFWSWFTPQLQLATLICFLALNIYAFTQLENSAYSDDISIFAETHGLSTSDDNSLFNQ